MTLLEIFVEKRGSLFHDKQTHRQAFALIIYIHLIYIFIKELKIQDESSPSFWLSRMITQFEIREGAHKTNNLFHMISRFNRNYQNYTFSN